MNARLKSLIHFLDDGIWRIREEEVSHLQWKGYTCLKIIYLSINQFINDRIVVRASALTYSTLLSIIPILALLFAIARGFGFDTLIESQFRSGVTGAQAELVISWINSYLEHAQSGVFIGVGLIMLLGTVLLLIDNIERQHLVIRVPDKRDRLTNKIHLTENGKKLEEKARFIANKTLKEALHGLTLEELRISQEVLRKIFTNTKD